VAERFEGPDNFESYIGDIYILVKLLELDKSLGKYQMVSRLDIACKANNLTSLRCHD
jgi:hypothetical protein